ncbi:hypothetical protein K1T71_006770 [Dendrolimus kikuchii]|uniref:Uncharacterized protein n=1 Tax=Dendrolimus kikuchii TaxID=765133 RepID=A0ACC1D2Y7_9NEOP|nr:hypothetical protein K1T71_006770 [Dendrolimus kikuchii]
MRRGLFFELLLLIDLYPTEDFHWVIATRLCTLFNFVVKSVSISEVKLQRMIFGSLGN